MRTYIIVDKETAVIYGTQRACNKASATYKFKMHSQHRNIRAVSYKRTVMNIQRGKKN